MGIPGRFNVDPWFSKPTSSTTPIQNRQTTKGLLQPHLQLKKYNKTSM
jgi:hypothetical protein